ncbi:uncharacterized protein LOC135366078 [Ornithodoros turicata]|uniref:uncharacterized protein LOC135366078 n=1 Tax=Ornithodoros turicata TaxID=34597 RepID=UPI00313A4253
MRIRLRRAIATCTAAALAVVLPVSVLLRGTSNSATPVPSGYNIRTQGCVIRKFDPFHPSVANHFEKVEEYACPGKPNFITIESGVPLVDTEALSVHGVSRTELACTYSEIYRNMSAPVPDSSFYYGPVVTLRFGQPLCGEFVFVNCSTTRSGKTNEVFHQQFLINPVVKKEGKPEVRNMGRGKHHNLSVLVLGLDSVSHLNFDRHLPLTADFVRSSLHAFELHGYNKVGDNSFPNQCPVLTGMTAKEALNASEDLFVDHLDFVWNHYANRGYRTMFVEEQPKYGIFNYDLNGFRGTPTDYYPRPLVMAVESSSITSQRSVGLLCTGPVAPTALYLDYLTRFVTHMKDDLFFAYVFLAEFSHETLNYAGYTDAYLRRFLGKFQSSGAADRTMLIFWSDHGMRYGPIRTTFIGKYEDRLPFAFIALPKSFLDAYPKTKRSLYLNQRRLTTPFDLHATMMEFLDFPESERPETKRGLSLFREVPPTRTCEAASIPRQWCSCEPYEKEIISPNDPLAWSMAEAFVRQMNEWLKGRRRKCDKVFLRDVLDVSAVQRTRQDRVQNISFYWVMLEVSPGGGIFEGTVGVNPVDNSFIVEDEVTRCNRYYLNSYCLVDHWLEQFCFCKRTYGVEL